MIGLPVGLLSKAPELFTLFPSLPDLLFSEHSIKTQTTLFQLKSGQDIQHSYTTTRMLGLYDRTKIPTLSMVLITFMILY